MTKPLVVYISGAPGSGKTTLGRVLSDQLYIPQVSSDLIHGGVALANPNHDRKATLKNVFVPTIVQMVEKGVSVVVDHVLLSGVSEADIIDRLRPHAEIINIHTQCVNPLERYRERVNTSKLPSIVKRREHLLSLMDMHLANLDKTSAPLDLDVPSLVVTTDDGYDPTIDDIIAFLHSNYTVTSHP